MEIQKIVLVNGVSSSGKTTLAKALQNALPVPYLHVCIDSFEDMMPKRFGEGGAFAHEAVLSTTLAGMHRSIAAMAEAGNNLIVDHILLEGEDPDNWALECLTLMSCYDVLMVGLFCPLAVLEKRERERGDRNPGLAAWQFPRMHRTLAYDVAIDSSVETAEEGAQKVMAALMSTERHGFARSLAGRQRSSSR